LRIARVEVQGLFGIFNHTIPLNLDQRITIIHGPNGYGKTMMLRLLAAVFSRRYPTLRNIPYDRFSIDFDDESRLEIRKEDAVTATGRPTGPDLVFDYIAQGRKEQLRIESRSTQRHAPTLAAISHEIPELERVGSRTWEYLPSGEILGLDEVLERFPVAWSGVALENPEHKATWLTELRKSIPVHFVEAQRLLLESTKTSADFERRPGLQQAVSVYSAELAVTIQSKLADFANLSQSLDRSFPFRVVQAKPAPELTPDVVKAQLASLEQRRRELRDAGLLDSERDINFPVVEDVDEEKRALLAVYIKDSNEKLAVFDDLARKTELMKKIINNRFKYKSVEINREEGISLDTEDGRSLPLTSLSSGEQHELVLLYELLFRVSEGSLILLDEPELSLHTEWQAAFLDDLLEIAGLRFLDVIVATHSPQIIGDRLDLTVELHGPGS
jgi:predicted ATP-binding protein involved in virulence